MPTLRLPSPLALLAATVAVTAVSPGDAATLVFRNGFEALVANTVQDVQQGAATGAVYLPDRVVTAVSSDRKNLWIADATAGTPFQGVFVFRGTGAPPLAPEIMIGARVNVFGDATEFDASPPGNTLTQLANVAIDLASPAGFAPAPLQLASVAPLASITDGEPYEGVLVRITNVRVFATASSGRVTVIDNNGGTLVLDDDAGSTGAPAIGTCYASITGVMHLHMIDDERRLLPRSAVDMTIGNGCI